MIKERTGAVIVIGRWLLRLCLIWTALFAPNLGAAGSRPAPLPIPTGPVILTVTGDISVTNDGEAARFDRDMLAEMGLEELTTGTPWSKVSNTFRGIPLHRLLERVGAQGDLIFAHALNDYHAIIPTSDAVPGGAFIAIERDGKPMVVRDKGPLWIIYPFDANDSFHSETIYSRSIWQLIQLDIMTSAPTHVRPATK